MFCNFLCTDWPVLLVTSQTTVLHYLTKGSATLSIYYEKQQFFMPVTMVMRALVNADDFGLYQQLIKGQEENQFFKSYVTLS